jgi:hypothetical protein
LSKVCRDLGGKTLIYGGGWRRDGLAEDETMAEAVRFFEDLTVRIEGHGTCFCFKPLGPGDSNFINSRWRASPSPTRWRALHSAYN